MLTLKRIGFFTRQYHKQLKRKWRSLPLLLLFPIFLIGLFLVILISLFSPSEEQPIQVGLVDLDQSEETTVLVSVIEKASLLGPFIHINSFSESEAKQAVKQGKASAYLTFPENFTDDLYNGKPVDIPIIGNPNNPIESYMIKELVESMARYIASAQANILTINEYAKQLPIAKDDRQQMLLDQFKQFLIYTLSKDKIVQEKVVTNLTTSSPYQYYALSGWFSLITIWSFSIYILLGREESSAMRKRMLLYGTTILQRALSRIFVSLQYGFGLAMIGFAILVSTLNIEFYGIDYVRIACLVLLYIVLLLTVFSSIDILIRSKKLTLLLQILWVGLILLLSGAILPTLYFPEKIQSALPFLFSTQAFDWMVEVTLKGRMFVDYTVLLLTASASVCMLIAFSIWKERWKE
ncbi:ABC transporter permease [Radiobacillus kanasensis]|uniref:ABC transporter permease n=1 Tax=Radiobacillus kanasensis TaxID=2844358 RepID=UPI001E5AE91A|nr:ABC transporter permease [Radiobacillus kanasensis]UFU00056.1 ABC transporter permease [Radiobacillus kanasensis]